MTEPYFMLGAVMSEYPGLKPGRARARQVEGAALALVHNEGGVMSSHCTVILGREPR